MLGISGFFNNPGSYVNKNPNALGVVIGNLLTIALSITGLITLVFIIIAGFGYMSSSGDQGQMEKSKKTLTSAIIGLVVVLFAFFITQVLMSLFNVPSFFDFTNFFNTYLK